MAKDEVLVVRIDDIPPEGKTLDFDLSKDKLNQRVSLVRAENITGGIEPPGYVFAAAPFVEMTLQLEGSTVVVAGHVAGRYTTPCARCAEETEQKIDTPFELVLKPQSGRNIPGAEEEDLHFGTYSDEQVNCSNIAEEFIVLSLPFTVYCKDDCKGLCSQCGKNLNTGPCSCTPEPKGDPRLSVLRDLKIVH